jgi:hypothetical protein
MHRDALARRVVVNYAKPRVSSAALEHKMTAESATKSDIALLRADIASATAEMKAGVAVVLSRLEQHEALTKAESAAIRSEAKSESAALRSEMHAIETRTFIRLGGLMVILIATVPKVLSWLGW